MTAPRLEACYFGPDRVWARMAYVLAHTAAQHCPGWRVHVERFDPKPLHHRQDSQMAIDNTQKLDRWAEIVEASDDGDRLLLIDADTMIVRPLDPVWDLEFDVAITARQFGGLGPLNGGVVFLRISPHVKAFFRSWRDVNDRMFHDYLGFHREWKKQYGGMNQAALGYMLKRQPPALRLIELPCQEWNCEDGAWQSFGPTTRIVHIKAALRHAIFYGSMTYQYLRPLVSLWREAELSARAVAS